MFIILLLMVHYTQSYPSQRCSTLVGEQYTICMGYSTNDMELRYFTDTKALCNDGSPAGYYIRQNTNSREWIVYLAGGWFCYDEKSCDLRMNQSHTKFMTTSKSLSTKRQALGLLKEDFHKNPQFWNANHIYVPYCSSDFWLGNSSRTLSSGKKVYFHGSHIITAVIEELLPLGLKDASRLILAGSSAGGIGVLQNIDRISKLLVDNHVNIDVRGLVDSAWFLDNGVSINCQSTNAYDCHPKLQFKQAIKFWNAFIRQDCSTRFGREDAYKCLFAHDVIKDITTPIFIFQWLYDTVQILADNKDLVLNIEDIFLPKYINYVSKLGHSLRRSLKKSISGIHGVFAVSCISHTALTTTDVLNNIELKHSSLNDALHCWLSSNKLVIKDATKERKCKHKFIDTCDHLLCNKQCPHIYNPMTGTKIRIPGYPPIDEGTSIGHYSKDIFKKDIDLINAVLNSIGGKSEKTGS